MREIRTSGAMRGEASGLTAGPSPTLPVDKISLSPLRGLCGSARRMCQVFTALLSKLQTPLAGGNHTVPGILVCRVQESRHRSPPLPCGGDVFTG